MTDRTIAPPGADLTPGQSPPAQPAPSLLDQIIRGLRIGTQGVGEGVGYILGTPGAILDEKDRALRQAGQAAAGAAFGEEGGETFAELLSETPAGRTYNSLTAAADRLFPEPGELQRGFGNDLRAVGLGDAIIPESEMTSPERISKAATALGTAAATGSAGAVRAARLGLGEKGLGRLLVGRERKALNRGKAGRRFAKDTLTGAFVGGGNEGNELTRPKEAAGRKLTADEPFGNVVLGATGSR